MQPASYLFRLASAPSAPFIVQRPDSAPSSSTDGEWFMKLRRRPDASRGADVWAEGMVSEGEIVTVIRMNAPDEVDFAWVQTASGAQGFLRSEFLAIAPRAESAVRHPEVLWKTSQLPLLHASVSSNSKELTHISSPYAQHISNRFVFFSDPCPQACLMFHIWTNLEGL